MPQLTVKCLKSPSNASSHFPMPQVTFQCLESLAAASSHLLMPQVTTETKTGSMTGRDCLLPNDAAAAAAVAVDDC